VTPPEVVMPYVACVSSPEQTDDGGTGDLDAGDGDAGASNEDEDGGLAAMYPCLDPPPATCRTKTSMIKYGPGSCIDAGCLFTYYVVECPGGCFRQLDGGEHCNGGKF
jgi:hypothetical protein